MTMKTAVVVIGMVVGLGFGARFADRGGKVRPLGTERCWVEPNPTHNGREAFTVKGDGYRPDEQLAILVGGGGWLLTITTPEGTFASSAWAAFTQTGTQTVVVRDNTGTKRPELRAVLAECVFEVVP